MASGGQLMRLAAIPSLSVLYKSQTLRRASVELCTPSRSLNIKVSTVRADITALEVDAIVNAANTELRGGGGVDGAIHRAAGSGLAEECRMLNGCNTGSAKITMAYNLPCKRVIHAVGPVYDSRQKQKSEFLLRGCYQRSLELAVESQCKSIAFSAISTGVYGYPSTEAAQIAISEVRKYLEGPDGEKIERVVFVTFEPKDVQAYNDKLPAYFPPTEEELSRTASSGRKATAIGTASGRPQTQNITARTASAQTQNESESFAAPPPRAPTTEPTSLQEPITKIERSPSRSNKAYISQTDDGEDLLLPAQDEQSR